MRNNNLKFSFLILVVFMLSLAACNHNRIARTLRVYGEKQGFELQIIHTDSLSINHQGLSGILKYLDGVKKVYMLKFDAKSGNHSVNELLYQRLQQQITGQRFERVLNIEGKSKLGLYVQKNKKGDIKQLVFIKSGGRHSLYLWAPYSKN